MRTSHHRPRAAMPIQDPPSVSPQDFSAIAGFIDVLGLELSTSANPLRKLIGLVLRRHARDVATMLAAKVHEFQPEAAAELLKGYANGSFE
ncbi:hypothetical protein [Zoogloea sp. LCSB751]|uniref:hypothetical protein n=1 Tax=Zoogloea sp. LCSB751 TaxID=1965277 RepID=UPI001116AB57|nr:hypothetical protein [Zoogloea sp. LCSB751]